MCGGMGSWGHLGELDAHNSEEYFPARLRPWGGYFTYVP